MLNFEPRGGAIFDPGDIMLTNLVEVHKVILQTKYQSFRPFGLGEDLKKMQKMSLCPTLTPGGQGHFWPQGMLLTNLVEVH